MPFESLENRVKEKEAKEKKRNSKEYRKQKQEQERVEWEKSCRLRLEKDFKKTKKTHSRIVNNYNLLTDRDINPMRLLEQLAEKSGIKFKPEINFDVISLSPDSDTPEPLLKRIKQALVGYDTPVLTEEDLLRVINDGGVSERFSSKIHFFLTLYKWREYNQEGSSITSRILSITVGKNYIKIAGNKIEEPISYERFVEILTQSYLDKRKKKK